MYVPTTADRVVGSAESGVGYLALRSGARVMPVACQHTDELARRPYRRPYTQMVLGPALPFARHPDGRPLNRRPVATATEHIRSALADLVAQIAPNETRKAA